MQCGAGWETPVVCKTCLLSNCSDRSVIFPSALVRQTLYCLTRYQQIATAHREVSLHWQFIFNAEIKIFMPLYARSQIKYEFMICSFKVMRWNLFWSVYRSLERMNKLSGLIATSVMVHLVSFFNLEVGVVDEFIYLRFLRFLLRYLRLFYDI